MTGDRLLMDEEVFKIHPWMRLPAGDDADNDLNTHRATAKAQDGKSVREDRKAMAEWLAPYLTYGRDGNQRLYFNNAGQPDILVELRGGSRPMGRCNPMMMRLKGCARCGGDMWLDREISDWEWACMLCGFRIPVVRARYGVPADLIDRRRERADFFREHRDAMLADAERMDLGVFLRKYGLLHGTWANLRKRWAQEAVTA